MLPMEKSVTFTCACVNEIIPSINRSFVYKAKEGGDVRILCLSCRKIPLIHQCLYFELNNKIIQLSLDCSFWYFLLTRSELDLQLVSQSSTGKTCEKGYQKSYISVSDKNVSSQCNLTAQIEQFMINVGLFNNPYWRHYCDCEM